MGIIGKQKKKEKEAQREEARRLALLWSENVDNLDFVKVDHDSSAKEEINVTRNETIFAELT